MEGFLEIVALVESEDHVCTRYRLSAYKEHFAKSGYSLRYLTWPKSLLGLLSLAAKLQNKTVIFANTRSFARTTVKLPMI
jgi:hypothetical protein